MSKKILILPQAGEGNPFQQLLANFLIQHGYVVVFGTRYRFFTFIRNIRKHKPDILYLDWVHSFFLGRNPVSTFFKTILFHWEMRRLPNDIPIYHTIHNLQEHSERDQELERRVYKKFLQKCSRLRVYSYAIKKKAIDIFKLDEKNIHVIQDVGFHLFYPNVCSKQEARQKLDIGENAFVYLFLGNIRPYKILEILIECFKEGGAENSYLIIAGEPKGIGYFKALEATVGDNSNIKFLPKFIEKEDVQYYLNAANIMVLPFRKISHSGSVDMAMAFGKPIITLATEAHQELLSHQRGLLFATQEELLECIRQAHNFDLKWIGEENKKIVESYKPEDWLNFF